MLIFGWAEIPVPVPARSGGTEQAVILGCVAPRMYYLRSVPSRALPPVAEDQIMS